jgi:hypothetical protein
MAKGGKREGAGRPKGSTSRPTIFDYWDADAIAEYFEYLRDNYKEDSRLMVFVGEQIMGKATQPVQHSGELNIIDDEARAKANIAIAAVLPAGDTE